MKINWRKVNNVLHRDVGYFFFGMCIIYALSGIALNHIADWDPNYIIDNRSFQVEGNAVHSSMTLEEVDELIDRVGVDKKIKIAYKPQYLQNDLDVEVVSILDKANESPVEGSMEEEQILDPLKIKKLYNKLNVMESTVSEIKDDTKEIRLDISQVTSMIEHIMENMNEVEEYMKENLGSDWTIVKNSWKKCKEGEISRKEFIKIGLKKVGKKFLSLFI